MTFENEDYQKHLYWKKKKKQFRYTHFSNKNQIMGYFKSKINQIRKVKV